MKRRLFVKNSILASAALSVPALLRAGEVDKAASPFFKIACDQHFPQFDFFSVDSLGKNMLQQNIALKDEMMITQMKYEVVSSNNITEYFLHEKDNTLPVWQVIQNKKSFTIISLYHEAHHQSFGINISQFANHATLLGLIEGDDQEVSLPAVLHCPDMGTMRVTCNIPGQKADYDVKRFIDHPYVKINFPTATRSNPKIEYHFEVVSIHPEIKGIENDERYDCFRRNFISIFHSFLDLWLIMLYLVNCSIDNYLYMAI